MDSIKRAPAWRQYAGPSSQPPSAFIDGRRNSIKLYMHQQFDPANELGNLSSTKVNGIVVWSRQLVPRTLQTQVSRTAPGALFHETPNPIDDFIDILCARMVFGLVQQVAHNKTCYSLLVCGHFPFLMGSIAISKIFHVFGGRLDWERSLELIFGHLKQQLHIPKNA